MKFWAHRALIGSVAIAGIAFFAACSSSTNDAAGTNGLGGAAQGGGSASTGAGGASNSGTGGLGGQTLMGVAGTAVQENCGTSGSCTCSDGKDNDGDGLIDGFDPECTGPLDNDEGSFATGIPGDNQDPKWQDCFFDGNSGGGDDGCRYATSCLTGDLPQTDKDCLLSQHCIDFCKPLIPNGCDCFGCCTVATKTGNVDILIGTSCSIAKIGDTTACPVCKKSTSCNNTCATCELCPGKTEVPASCAPPPADAGPPVGPPPPSYTCDTGHQVCSATIACPSGEYCSQGCCLPFLR